jgi:hypothetical protein
VITAESKFAIAVAPVQPGSPIFTFSAYVAVDAESATIAAIAVLFIFAIGKLKYTSINIYVFRLVAQKPIYVIHFDT